MMGLASTRRLKPVQWGIVATASVITESDLTTNNTFEDVTGASVTFTPMYSGLHTVEVVGHWSNTSNNWTHNMWRLLLDGSTTGTSPTSIYVGKIDTDTPNLDIVSSTVRFEVDIPSIASHTIKLQSSDGGASVDRRHHAVYLTVWGWV